LENLLVKYKRQSVSKYQDIIIKNIISVLDEYHLTHTDCANAMLLSKQNISDVLNKRRDITMYFLFQFSNFFCISIDWLLGRSDEKYPATLVLKLEKSCSSLFHQKKELSNPLLGYVAIHKDSIPDSYKNETIRTGPHSPYTLEERAQIIATINIIAVLKKDERLNTLEDEMLDKNYKDRRAIK
jgi:hypothetical protein